MECSFCGNDIAESPERTIDPYDRVCVECMESLAQPDAVTIYSLPVQTTPAEFIICDLSQQMKDDFYFKNDLGGES